MRTCYELLSTIDSCERPRLESAMSGEISSDSFLRQEQQGVPGRAEAFMTSSPYSGLAAFIDEPLVIRAAISFFHDQHKMIGAIYSTTTYLKSDPAIIGNLWERWIPEEMARIFVGTKAGSQLALSQSMEDLD
ncbi:uncharacterized protein VTP21DRAFT_8942 [Calcarisporiella thermophila]|uniref:uncharacterized protein n=1 Tax=Calcarisporiella thermophila TaxID=911321 RepID=UPI003742AAED